MSENQSGKHGNRLRVQVAESPADVNAAAWDALLSTQAQPTPFMRHAYLAALHTSGSAVPKTGWTPRFFLLWDGAELTAACPLYVKAHSYGEYVFDWAWANAYAEHGLRYYPKALVAVPFTPVPGSRLLARDDAARAALVRALLDWCAARKLSSLHLLFGDAADRAACAEAGLMERRQVQFHWLNQHPARGGHFTTFDDFLAALNQEKRKKIRQERRKVAEAGVTVRHARGADITADDWAFFQRCYQRTYYEHGNPPYLTPDFFARMASDMAANWLLFVAEHDGQPIATSLIAINQDAVPTRGQNDSDNPPQVAYGRYWGALARVDNLHFELCYYQPIEWCIANGVARFEGGAQGEHKMARALMPTATHSAHWLAHPAFSDAVERFLARESSGIDGYLEHLQERTPFRHTSEAPPPQDG